MTRDDFFPETIEESYRIAADRIVSAYRFSQNLGMGKLYVAFSGGKDSVAVYGVCRLAAEMLGVDVLDMCEFHYNITNVDPPELVTFIKEQFPFVHRNRPSIHRAQDYRHEHRLCFLPWRKRAIPRRFACGIRIH